MTRTKRESTMGRVCAALALLLMSGACSGERSTGFSPTAPLEVVEVAGYWGGTATVQSASGCGCVGSEFTSGLRDKPTEWEISQRGESIEGAFYDGLGPGWCDFQGNVDMNEFGAASTRCEQERLHWECKSGEERDLVLRGVDWQGQIHLPSSSIKGTGVTTWDCFDSMNGQAVGTLAVQSSLRLSRGASDDTSMPPGAPSQLSGRP